MPPHGAIACPSSSRARPPNPLRPLTKPIKKPRLGAGAESKFLMTIQIDEAAPRRKTDDVADRLTNVLSDRAVDMAALTRGGLEIYRRVHRPTSTYNMLATLAGIGIEWEAR